MSMPQAGSQTTDQSSVNQNTILARYEPVIGLEVHCQLDTKSKLFCSCSTSFGALPNENTCEICLGQPGSLPVINEKALRYAVMMAIAVEADIRQRSVFARKQYFYPDLPKGYQISQYDLPYCNNGKVTLSSGKKITIGRIHLEEDAGKNTHSEQKSFVDLNRAGIPLIEIVSEPEISSPQEASEYLKILRSIVRYIGISDGDLEKGSFRCDANVSIRPRGQKELGTRCEIKNLNSFKNIERAISYEIIRQADLLDHSENIKQMTLLFDPASGKTKAMRSKEESEDYRYFPDPDLKPLEISQEKINQLKESLPELPAAKKERFKNDYKLNDYDAYLLTSDKDIASYFEDVRKKVGGKVSEKIIANWINSEFLREANQKDWDLTDPPVSSEQFSKLLILMGEQVISGKIAKMVFSEMVETGKAPDVIVEEKGLKQVIDHSAIASVIEDVISSNQNQLEQYLSGKEKVFGFFVGQVMRKSGGKFNPAIVNQILKEKLNEKK